MFPIAGQQTINTQNDQCVSNMVLDPYPNCNRTQQDVSRQKVKEKKKLCTGNFKVALLNKDINTIMYIITSVYLYYSCIHMQIHTQII